MHETSLFTDGKPTWKIAVAGTCYANPLAKAICKETRSQWSEVGKDDLPVIKAVLSLTSSFLICAYTLRICGSAELQQQRSHWLQ